MKDDNSIELINEAIYQNMEYKFKQAGIPMIKFHIYNHGDDTFSVSAMFHNQDDENVEMKLKVTEMLTERNGIQMISKSGTIESKSDFGDEDKIFTMLSWATFNKIAQEASRFLKGKTGKDCYTNQLKRLDCDEFINVDNITYVDFENLDLKDVDWDSIYSS